MALRLLLVTLTAALADGLRLQAPCAVLRGVRARSPVHAIMCTPADDVQKAKMAAAQRVVQAAIQFGDAQGDAAKAWVAEALAGKGNQDASRLLEQQMSLFEECIIGDDDDGAKCKELDMALSDLEETLNEGCDVSEQIGSNGCDRAALRVAKAASHFGEEQAEAANEWLVRAKESGANPAHLLQSQQYLFGECMIDEDGGSSRCVELQEAIAALQASLGVGGKVFSTRGLMPQPKMSAADDDGEPEEEEKPPQGPPPPEGFEWGLEF